jgi:hypothetical protein
MGVLASLRKGFGFFLMSMGVSSPVKKPGAPPRPATPKTAPPQDPEQKTNAR